MTRSTTALLFAVACLGGNAALGQAPQKLSVVVPGPGAPPSTATLKPIPGAIPWATFQETRDIARERRFVPKFSPRLLALDGKNVKVQGFVIPLEAKASQSRFLLAAQPSDCRYCLEGGPRSFVEVVAKGVFKATEDPVVVTGKLHLLRDDPLGVLYRLVDATAVRAN